MANDKAEAIRAIAAYRTPRFYRLDRFERFAEGTQYEGLADWWDDRPIFEKAPCVVYPIVASAVKSNIDLMFGEGRFPTLSAAADEDSSDEADGADKVASQSLESLLKQIVRQVRFKAVCREAFAHGQNTGTSVTIYGIRNGQLFVDSAKSKWCEAKFDIDGNVEELEIRYGFIEQTRVNGKWEHVGKLYRRVINKTRDTTYRPARAESDGTEPRWVADPAQTFEHNLGFCPVVWYRHDRGCAAVNEVDGQAIHRLALSEISALDYSLSQRHRVALLSEPQPWETGVPPDHNPTGMGRTATVPASLHGGEASSSNPITASYGATNKPSAAARKKGPGHVWRYPSPEAKVGYLTVPAGALDAIDSNCRDLRIKIAESLCVVFLDPEQAKVSSISGRALRALKQRQLDRCDQLRDDVEDGFIQPALWMLLRLAVKGGLSGAEAVTSQFPDIMKVRPMFTLNWGQYFPAEPDEELNIVKAVNESGENTTLEQKVRKLAPIFGTTDVAKVLDALQDEQLTRMIAQEKIADAAAKRDKAAQGDGAPKPGKPPTGKGGDDSVGQKPKQSNGGAAGEH